MRPATSHESNRNYADTKATTTLQGETTVESIVNPSAATTLQAPPGCETCCCEAHHRFCLMTSRAAQAKLPEPISTASYINARTEDDEDEYLDCAGPQMGWQQDHDAFLTACVSLQTTFNYSDETSTSGEPVQAPTCPEPLGTRQ